MSAVEFLRSSRILIVAGKGGVGKTTVGATLGVASARSGLNTLLVELEGHSTLGRPFGIDELPYEDVDLIEPDQGRLRGRRITPDEALVDYLSGNGLDRITGRLARTGTIDVVATAAPGIRDLLTLGKIRQIEETEDVDLIVVDAPAAGHAVTFLRSAAGLSEAGADGPVKDQADLVSAMLSDDARCQVVLVTLAEETPITEVIETAYSLEDDVGVALGPIVVNSLVPPMAGLEDDLSSLGNSRSKVNNARRAAAKYRIARRHSQAEEVDRLDIELPLPRIDLPMLFRAGLDQTSINELTEVMLPQLETLGRQGGASPS